MQYGKVLLGVVLALVVVAVLAGVGFTAYNAGVSQGLVDSGKLVMPVVGEGTAPAAPFTAPFGYYRPFGFPRFGYGFGFLGCLVPLFIIFMLFALFRLVFRPRWGRSWGGPWMRGGWDPSQGDIPPAVKEWHRKLHEQESGQPTTPAAPGA